MEFHETQHRLQSVINNAQALLGLEQRARDNDPRDAAERPALITKLRASIREEVAALFPTQE